MILREAVGKSSGYLTEIYCFSGIAAYRRLDPDTIRKIQATRGDLWHAGLRLGLQGKPSLVYSVESTWLLNADPDPMISSTSWRLSLRAALIPSSVLSRFDFIRPEFESIDTASLELGYRLLTNGVLMRHTPELVPAALQ